MKNKIKSTKLNKLDNLLTLSNNCILSLNDMKKVRGGDGEDNGGGDIIMPLPKLK